MLTVPQREHLEDATKRLADSLDKDQQKKLYFLVDDILQYGPHQAAYIVHDTLVNYRKE